MPVAGRSVHRGGSVGGGAYGAAVTETETLPPAAAPRQRAAAGTLSPSRAADFKQCPLLYRFRVVDRIPEPPSSAAARGTVVHTALERIFDVPAAERTPEAATRLLRPALDEMLAERPEVAALFGTASDSPAEPGTGADSDRPVHDVEAWLGEAAQLVERWFTLEDPTRLEPESREVYVEHRVSDDLVLRGIVDRVDVAPDGRIRIVDYKTGRAPSEAFEQKALFQMKFYALVLWRLRGRVPSQVQLVYVGGRGETLPLEVDEEMLVRFERTLVALWQAIRTAARDGDWRPRRSRLCDWCSHTSICPAFGGTAPPLPEGAAERVLGVQEPETPGLDES